MKNKNKKTETEKVGDTCDGNGCHESGMNSNPVADMGILMSNDEDCPGSADFWMARIKYALHRNPIIP